MVKQINYYFILALFSFLFSQELIETREFTVFKNFSDYSFDFNEIVDLNYSNYRVEVIAIKSIDVKNTKKTIIPKCEIDIEIGFPSNKTTTLIKSKDKNVITAKVCEGVFESNNFITLDKNNSLIELTSTKNIYDMQFEVIFWISGKFGNNKMIRNDSNHGYLREWYDDGDLYIEYKFNNGKKNGIQKRWYPNGQQEILYNYNKGKLHGTQKKWHKNGILKFKTNYQNDVQHGKSEEWHSDGSIKFIKIFNQGVLIDQLN